MVDSLVQQPDDLQTDLAAMYTIIFLSTATTRISNQFSLICNMSRWFSFLNEVATGSIPAGWVRGVTWVPIFLYSSILTSLRKENHLDILQMREN